MDMLTVYTGAQITALREQLDMSPTEFAAALGVSASAVCYWERGRNSPRMRTLLRMNEMARAHAKGIPSSEEDPSQPKRKAKGIAV